MKRILAAICLSMCAGAAQADVLVAGLSQDIIQITSNYTGTDIVAFGAIENMNVMTAAGPLDVVVVVRGPDADMIVRKKERVAGIWLNNHGVVMRAIPSYYYVASTRPLSAIAPEDTLRRYELGLDLIEPDSTTARTPGIAEPYRQALVRHKLIDGLYNENAGGVEFLSPTLFRARVPVPANIVMGTSLLQIIFVTASSTILHSVSDYTVDIVLAGILISGGVIGAQFGVRMAARLRGEQLRFLLALLVLAVGARLLYGLLVSPGDPFSISADVL
jgi:uncharacterized protein (TIGR02186 family)